jgi:hypothetical protein
MIDLRLSIVQDQADAAGLEREAIQLAQEVEALDVDRVGPLPAGETPPGARSGSIAAIGALLVSLEPTTRLLTSLVQTVRGWLKSRGGNRTVHLELGGDVLELSGATTAQQEQLVDAWIRAHAKDEPAP